MSRPDVQSPPTQARIPAESLLVRKIRVDDAEAFARILSDPAVYPQLLQMPYGNADLWRARLADLCAPGRLDLLLVAVADGEVVGGAGLHPVGTSPRKR